MSLYIYQHWMFGGQTNEDNNQEKLFSGFGN